MRVLFVFAILIVLLFLASAILQTQMNQNFWAIFFQSILYLTFWSALCFSMVGLQKSSNFNVLALISIWVVLTILLPVMVNNYVLNKYQVPEALTAMVKQRGGYHEKCDLEKDATMTGFFEAYPLYKNYAVPEDEFSWIWYYGMQHMGGLAAKETSAEMNEKIMMRNTVSEKVALLITTVHAQLSFITLAETDMVSHL